MAKGVELATAYYSLVPSMDGTAAAVRSQLGAVEGAAAGIGASAGNKMGGGMVAAAAKFAAPLLAAVGISSIVDAAVGFANESVDAFSALNESANAVKVTYGEAAEGIVALGETAAKRLGLSRRAFNEIATRFSGFASTIVGEGGDVVGLIDDLSTRGADFASVYNIDVDDALTLFQSGLAGETEPLRRFGLDLSAAAVETFAYANGIGTVGTELTEAEKVQARYLLLMQETTAVAGDFANTSDSLANAQRIQAAAYEDTTAKLGEDLYPLYAEFTDFMVTSGIPALEEFIDLIGPGVKFATLIGVIGLKGISEILPPLIDTFRIAIGMLSTFVRLFNSIVGAGPLTMEIRGGGKSLSKIPGAANGALVGATPGGSLLQVGEGRHNEAILPLSSAVLAEIGAAIPVHGSGGGVTQYITLAPEQDPRIVGRQLGREFVRETAGR